jgi:hypothetical protein
MSIVHRFVGRILQQSAALATKRKQKDGQQSNQINKKKNLSKEIRKKNSCNNLCTIHHIQNKNIENNFKKTMTMSH